METTQSRRILFLGSRNSGTLDVVKDLTGSAPAPDINGSTAGLTHEWTAKTAYYAAKIPIWIDEVEDFKAWQAEFTKEEAKEVVDAVGAWIFCFERAQDGNINEEVEQGMKSIQAVVEQHANYGADCVFLALAKPKSKAESSGTAIGNQEDNEDQCMQYGFEYIDYTATGTNNFGEKLGFDRMKEALEANEWAATGDEDEDVDFDDLDFTEADGGFGLEEAEMTAELFGMKAALNQDEDEEEINAEDFLPPQKQNDQVDDLDRMMGKLLAIKEQSADLPEQQKKRMAAKAVRELMKENSNV